MPRIEILVEEPSMKEFLSILLPKVIKKPWKLNENYFIRAFEGKSDLQKNIPSKVKYLSSLNHEKASIVIIQDQDSADCKFLKQKLVEICERNGNCPKLIRIVCRELEAWYIGDFKALNKAYPHFKYENYHNKSKFRNPDTCNAFDELRKIIPEFQKVGGAKKIAPYISIKDNKSVSFQQTISGLIRFFKDVNA